MAIFVIFVVLSSENKYDDDDDDTKTFITVSVSLSHTLQSLKLPKNVDCVTCDWWNESQVQRLLLGGHVTVKKNM